MAYIKFKYERVRLIHPPESTFSDSVKSIFKPVRFRLNVESDISSDFTIQQGKLTNAVYIFNKNEEIAKVSLGEIVLEEVPFCRVYGGWKKCDKWRVLGRTMMEYTLNQGYKLRNGSVATVSHTEKADLISYIYRLIFGKKHLNETESSIKLEFDEQSFDLSLAYCIMGIEIIDKQLESTA